MSNIEILVPPGLTQEEFEKLLKEYIAGNTFDAIISYLKETADLMDERGLEHMTSDDLRRLALEMSFKGYQPQ